MRRFRFRFMVVAAWLGGCYVAPRVGAPAGSNTTGGATAASGSTAGTASGTGACLANGATCREDADCCSGACDGRCDPFPVNASSTVAASTSTGSSSTAGSSTGTSGSCLAEFAPCSFDAQCCTGTCYAGGVGCWWPSGTAGSATTGAASTTTGSTAGGCACSVDGDCNDAFHEGFSCVGGNCVFTGPEGTLTGSGGQCPQGGRGAGTTGGSTGST